MLLDEELEIAEETESYRNKRLRFGIASINGSLSKAEFKEICEWKSHRNAIYPDENSQQDLDGVFFEGFKKGRVLPDTLNKLIKLRGVQIPTASVFLTLYAPDEYGIIDYHAWQALYRRGLVSRKESGKNLTVDDYMLYVNQIRRLAKKYQTTPRIIDLSLMRENQRNTGSKSGLCWFST
ncbi:hypothetical protein [Vibrio parahaemolyticus]|uniref:hypothetical protein n=1 Tax=Vibrio parahaemolyticus TaxID=670 RepID=UPI00215D40A6|nr:hypothetical protein [Vibrio parahaemolyticus]MBE5136856.1 hypothetical protein [Vibrio parahaemolyticus]MCF9448054.1 hypothetical protein [Vibrio parahaemolyticus]MCS0066453.1 hypothetical protein [Vibrio parahaemolyticus]